MVLPLPEVRAPDVDGAPPAFQVIMLGSGGGPSEGNTSGYLVRSTSTKWAKNSVLAVDAGTHLSGIIRILEEHSSPSTTEAAATKPNGTTITPPEQQFPFHGIDLPSEHPCANASHIIRELVSTYLITHTHLDHLAGFVINTAAFTDTKNPKRLAALPNVITAVKSHIFNDIIWPNLSDEDAGVGLLSYQRLPIAQGYVSVSEGLSAQAWPVSHGHCMKLHTHWGRKSTAGLEPCDGDHNTLNHQAKWCVLDSTVFFIRDEATGKEVMMWGDVEPDSVSLDPRNVRVWQEAARKIYAGSLTTIFIECSYALAHPDGQLYGHLSPSHLMAELKVLAESVEILRAALQRERSEKLKRKRLSTGYANEDFEIEGRRRSNPNPPDAVTRAVPASSFPFEEDISPRTSISGVLPGVTQAPLPPSLGNRVLEGLLIVVTHVKDTMTGEDVPARVLADLEALEKEAGLGCRFALARQGGGIYF